MTVAQLNNKIFLFGWAKACRKIDRERSVKHYGLVTQLCGFMPL